MKPRLDALLCARYPALFADRNRPSCETLMVRGFACGDGWFDLLDKLCADIQGIVAKGALQPLAVFVGQTDGALAFHLTRSTAALRKAIKSASERSRSLCEVCGEPGLCTQIRTVRTLCTNHANATVIQLVMGTS